MQVLLGGSLRAVEWDSVAEVRLYHDDDDEPLRLTAANQDVPCCVMQRLTPAMSGHELTAEVHGTGGVLTKVGPVVPPTAPNVEADWWIRGEDYTVRWKPAGASHVVSDPSIPDHVAAA
jgi:hypothetical protein